MNKSEQYTNLLLVDDRKENLVALKAIIDSPDITIYSATSGNEALGLMLEQNFALVLLDVQMPEMDGFEVAELMRRKEKTRYIPIIFITAISKEEQYIFKGYQAGAVDYLFKPIDPMVLKSKIRIFLELHRNKMELEKSRLEIEKQNKRLKEMSIRDGLTGLYNFRYFQELLNREFLLAKRNHSDLSCFMIDLDYFKDVNDTFGHTFGDYVLRNFASLTQDITRKTDILCRYGGEEFVLLLPHTSLEGARILAEKFRQRAERFHYIQKNHSKYVTISIGISSYLTHQPVTADELVNFADRALYRAKADGRNNVKIFREEELIQIGTLANISSNHVSTSREQLKRIIDNSRESILTSLELFLQNTEQNSSSFTDLNMNLKNDHKAMKIFDFMGERLGMPRTLVHTFKRAIILHELFRVFIKDNTAQYNRPLNESEKKDIEDYPFMMEEMTRLFDIFADERTILRYHHENFDGSGYPEGLRGSEVPIGARLFSLVDAFVAMTSKRSYRPTLSPEEIIMELVKQAGSQFDPILVTHMLEVIEDRKLLILESNIITKAKQKVLDMVEAKNGYK